MAENPLSKEHLSPRSLRTAFLLGAAVLILLVVTTVTSGWLLYRAGLDDWKEDLATISTILEESTAQTLGSARLVLDGIDADLAQLKIADEADLLREVGTEQFARILDEKIRNLPQIGAAAVVDSRGKVIALSREFPPPQISVADREYFLRQMSGSSLGAYVSEVNLSRYNGSESFYMSQRLSDKNGQFLGVAVIALPCAFFEHFFSNISKDKPFAITLYRSDYKRLATNDLSGKLSDSTRKSISLEKVAVHQLLGQEQSSGKRAVFFLDAHRLGIQRSVRDNPVLIEISVTDSVYFDDWLHSMYPLIAVGTVSLAALVFVFFVVLRLLKKREEDAQTAILLKGEADSANEAKSRFLAMVSHEIRTPMNGMLGLTELMLESDLTPQQKQYADGIHGASRSLVRIINDILDLSKVESGRMDLESVAFSPVQLVQTVTELYEPSAKKKGLNLEVTNNCPPGLWLLGDPAKLTQILGNLLSNAIKFTESGQISMMLTVSQSQHELRTLEFTIIDSGIGISEEAIENLFEPFSQADNSISRRFGGTGLGLAICKNLAEMMGGMITCQSTQGLSTTFQFSLKCAEALTEGASLSGLPFARIPEADVSISGMNSLEQKNDDAADDALVKGPRILLVEDTEINRQLVRLLLTKLGCPLREVVNGKEAVEAVRAEQFDLILMDCMMPVMDGYEATQLIRGYESELNLHRTPIVALTASAIEGDRQRCLDADMDDYLSKPFTSIKLTEMINKWIKFDCGKKQQI